MWNLIKANLRKGKAGLITVTIFMILAVFLMTVGVTLIIRVPNLYAEKEKEINSPHVQFAVNRMVLPTDYKIDIGLGLEIALPNIDFTDNIMERVSQLSYVENSEQVECARLSNNVSFRFAQYTYTYLPVADIENPGAMTPPYEKLADGEGIPIYLSSWYNVQKTMQAGDAMDINVNGTIYKAYIAGFYESIVNLYSSFMYTDNASFNLIKGLQEAEIATATTESPAILSTYLNIQFNETYDINLQSKFARDYENIYLEERDEKLDSMYDYVAKQLPITPNEDMTKSIKAELFKLIKVSVYHNGIEVTVNASEPYMLLISVMMIVFALVMTVIALIIINYLIKAGIDEDIRNIGILKALGYTTGDLRKSYLLLYGVLVAIGSILGVIIAISSMPLFNMILLLINNISMIISPNIFAGIGSVALVCVVFFTIIWLITMKLKKISPLYAFKGNISKKNHIKNVIPLDTSKLSLNMTLGVKSVLQNKRQTIMTSIIVGVMTLITAFSMSMYYNMNVDQTTMVKMSGEQTHDYTVSLKLPKDTPVEEYNRYYDAITNRVPEVTKVTKGFYKYYSAWMNDEYTINIRWADDYSVYDSNPVYEGTVPTTRDECTVAGDLRKALNLKIGDKIGISLSSAKESIDEYYTIVGFTQGLYLGGHITLTTDGMRRLTADDVSILGEYFVDISDDAIATFDTAIFKELATELYPDTPVDLYVNNQNELLNSKIFQVIKPASTLLMNIIILITVIAIVIIIFMLIRMKMIREKKNIAVSKAIGSSSFAIMHQTGISMFISSFPASLIGGLLGGLLINPFMNLVGGFIGLYKVGFAVPFGYIILTSAILGVLVYAITLLVSLSTRFISPRTLVAT